MFFFTGFGVLLTLFLMTNMVWLIQKEWTAIFQAIEYFLDDKEKIRYFRVSRGVEAWFGGW